MIKNKFFNRYQWLRPVILATQETEIRRIAVQGQPRQNESETLSRKYPIQKRAGRWLKWCLGSMKP
jgi:hypothetical protein